MIESLFSFFSFLFGLLVGSFLNVCIYRLPRGQSIVLPRSRCVHCGHFLRGFDNVPVLSFLWLKGRCAFCRKKISWRYPVVEILTGIFSFLIFLKFGPGWKYLFYFLFFTAPLVVVFFIDLEHKIIPNRISLPGIGVGIGVGILSAILSHDSWVGSLFNSLKGILVGGGTLFFVSWIYEKLKHQEGIGGGDVKLSALLGAFFGAKGALFILLFSSFFGSIVGLVLMIFFKKGLKTAIPFRPFLVVSGLFYLLYGEPVIQWYFRKF